MIKYHVYSERIETLNAGLKACRVAQMNLTAACQPASRPFVVYSQRGDYLGRYGSLDTAERAARRHDAIT